MHTLPVIKSKFRSCSYYAGALEIAVVIEDLSLRRRIVMFLFKSWEIKDEEF